MCAKFPQQWHWASDLAALPGGVNRSEAILCSVPAGHCSIPRPLGRVGLVTQGTARMYSEDLTQEAKI